MLEMINQSEARIYAAPSESPFKRLSINRKQDVLARSRLIQAGDPFGDHRA
jgi:hypothetical protein